MNARRAWVLVTVASFVSSMSLPAAGIPQPIRSGVELVPVTFLAVAEDGRPVPDLKAHEISVRINNRERPIKSLEFVRLAGASIGADSQPKPLPAPFASNRLVEAGRMVMLVVAHEAIRPGKERPAMEAAVRFVTALSPRDRVSLLLLPRGRVDVDFTTEHDKIVASLRRFVGQAPDNPSEADQLCRSRLTLHGLRDALGSLQLLDTPKTIVFISSGLMPPKRDGSMSGVRVGNTTNPRVGWAPGACELLARDFDDVRVAASLANAHFYVIQPEDLRVDSGRPPSDAMSRVHAVGPVDPGRKAFADPSVSRFASSDDELMGLQNLAGVTEGEIFRLASTPADRVFARIARESSGYYLAAVEPDPAERNGVPQRLAIQITREHVTLRAASQVRIAAALAKGDAPTPQKLLRAGGLTRELPLRLTAYTSRDASTDGVRIFAAAEPLERSATLTAAAFGVFQDGRLIVQSTIRQQEMTSPLMAVLPVRAGRYRVRVAAVDGRGRSGSADFDVDAQLTAAGPLKASALALGVMRDGELTPQLEFSREAAAIVYLEIYGRPERRDSLSVSVEIGETLDGPPLGTIPARVVQSSADPERYVVTAAIPIGGLLPGDFILRAIVNDNGKPVARVLRTLRKAADR